MSIFIKKDKKRVALEKEYAAVLKKRNAVEAECRESGSTPLENGSGEESAGEGLPQFGGCVQQGVFRGIYPRRQGHRKNL